MCYMCVYVNDHVLVWAAISMCVYILAGMHVCIALPYLPHSAILDK